MKLYGALRAPITVVEDFLGAPRTSKASSALQSSMKYEVHVINLLFDGSVNVGNEKLFIGLSLILNHFSPNFVIGHTKHSI